MSDPTMMEATNGEQCERPFADDNLAVQEFAGVMLEKLRENRHKAHWSAVTGDYLLQRLKDEVKELESAMTDGYAVEIVLECADVANFAMMISDNMSSRLEVGNGRK